MDAPARLDLRDQAGTDVPLASTIDEKQIRQLNARVDWETDATGSDDLSWRFELVLLSGQMNCWRDCSHEFLRGLIWALGVKLLRWQHNVFFGATATVQPNEQRRRLREKFSLLVDLKPEDIAASSMDEQLVQRLLAVFEDHMEEPDFSIEQLAQEIGMSRRHLNRKIQSMTNLSTSDFIRTLRLQKAARLLKSASGTVSEIAFKVGFNNLSYFSKAFRRHFGRLPSDFINK